VLLRTRHSSRRSFALGCIDCWERIPYRAAVSVRLVSARIAAR